MQLNQLQSQLQPALQKRQQSKKQQSNDLLNKQNYQIGNYKIISKLGKGSFGQVLLASKINNNNSLKTKEQLYAIKVEIVSNFKPMLPIQYQIYKHLYSNNSKSQTNNYNFHHQNAIPFPKIYQFSNQETYSFMVMENLHQTLQQKINSIKNINTLSVFLSQPIILQIMIATLYPIQLIHKKGYLHRDIKPNNYMIRKNQQNQDQIVLMDLGLAKKYIKSNGEHINCKEGKKITGTPIYCSRHTHQGIQQSRRDDLESWLYTILHLINKLPWEISQILNQKDKFQQNQKISNMKLKIILSDILKGDEEHQYPQCLKQIGKYILNLQFLSDPNYQYLFKCIISNGNKLGIKFPQRMINRAINWKLEAKMNPRISPQKNKDLKIKFNLKNKINNKQISKIAVQQLDKLNLFDQIINQGKKYS